MRLIPTVLAFILCSTFAAAQTTAYTIAVFGPTVTNPDIATPIAPAVTYPAASIPCNQVKVAETLPITNPIEGRFDDPADATKDCAVTIAPQFNALPVGTGYKASVKVIAGAAASAWSPLSSPFAVTAQTAHPCDGAAPTTGSVLSGTRTVSWCFSGVDANGQPTTVTSWAIYVDGARAILGTVTVGATANAAGQRLYQAPVTLASGTRVVQVAGVNAVGEAVRSASFTSTVTVPPAAPAVSVIRGIQ